MPVASVLCSFAHMCCFKHPINIVIVCIIESSLRFLQTDQIKIHITTGRSFIFSQVSPGLTIFLCQYLWNVNICLLFVTELSKLCKFYFIDKFVKNICKYLSVTDHLLEYRICIHNTAEAACWGIMLGSGLWHRAEYCRSTVITTDAGSGFVS